MKFTIIEPRALDANNSIVATKCPHCNHNGTFHSFTNDVYSHSADRIFAVRRCPNPKCYGQLFVVLSSGGKIIITYPSETIPFEKDGIPDMVLNSFEEAIICHANNCFVASAIMIRKTLEVICADRSVKGENLYKRLINLSSNILIPKELIEGMQELRLLGNDAAHIETTAFNAVGKNEIEISIEFTKEILKAVYQYEGLLGKLKSLKKS